MPEWEFYTAVIEKAGIYMMLDVNNIYVSSRNHNFDPREYCAHIPWNKVLQIHIAGHTDQGDYVLDTHDHRVSDAVWNLYGEVIAQTGPVSTLLEWDQHFLSFEDTCKESLRAKTIREYYANVSAKTI